MKIDVRYFASVREALGRGETLDVPPGSTLKDVRDALIAKGGSHAEVLAYDRALRTALNQTLSDQMAEVGERDEVAFFPPVTGG